MKIHDKKQQQGLVGRFSSYAEKHLPEIGDALALYHWRTFQRY